MRRLKFLLAFISLLLLLRCNNEQHLPESDTLSGSGNAQVINNTSNIVIENWEYLSPRSDEALQSFPSQDSEAIAFGSDKHEAYIVWHEDGFDVIWGNVICSTEPILTIGEATIALWLNDGIWDDCEDAQVTHAFRVELVTDIPLEAWTYSVHTNAPPSE